MDDDSIVRMYWERNEKAISVTSEKYGSYCLSIAKNILDNQEDAEECVNDTYLNAWNSIPPNRPKILSTYLGKIVRNLSFNVYKRNKAEKRGSGQIALVLDEPLAIVADSKNQEDEWNRKLLVSAINAFLSELPTEKRKIIVCRYWYAAGM
jgi:RNA polymerase sigma factor (sigma-70 family)